MSRRLLVSFAVAAVLTCCLTTNQTAMAHVLLVDGPTKTAAVFHANPDDDPVAGEMSELYFDIQDAGSSVRISPSDYELVITDEAGRDAVVSTHAAGNTVIAGYVFPAQGLYALTLRSHPAHHALHEVTLKTSLRVSRGAGAQAVRTDSHQWAAAGLIFASVASLMLVIVFVNNRSDIIALGKM